MSLYDAVFKNILYTIRRVFLVYFIILLMLIFGFQIIELQGTCFYLLFLFIVKMFQNIKKVKG